MSAKPDKPELIRPEEFEIVPYHLGVLQQGDYIVGIKERPNQDGLVRAMGPPEGWLGMPIDMIETWAKVLRRKQ
jgi:hypothetical protein